MGFQKIYRLKNDSDLRRYSKKIYSHFIEILHAKGHFEYHNGGYPLLVLQINFIQKKCVKKASSYRDSALLELQPESERLPHEYVGIVAGEEGPLQLLQLPAIEVGSTASSLAAAVVAFSVAACNEPTMKMEH